MNHLPAGFAESLLCFLEKDELVAISTVSKRWRRAAFSSPNSRLYAKTPLQDISRLSSAFSVRRCDDRDFLERSLVVRRLRLLNYDRYSLERVLVALPLDVLVTLDVSGIQHLLQVDRLGDCPHLHTLNLRECQGLVQVDRLGDCPQLHTLDLSGCHCLTQVDRLGQCQNLHSLNLDYCCGLLQIDRLGDCHNLHTLSLRGAAKCSRWTGSVTARSSTPLL